MKQLTSYEQFQSLIENQSERILFKHSGRCSISGGACKEIELTIEALNLTNIYQLDVFATQNLKYEIADFLKIRHESPQVIIFKNGKVQEFASHQTITQGWLTNELEGRNDTRK